MIDILRNSSSFVLDLLFPPVCVFCGEISRRSVCAECADGYMRAYFRECGECGRRAVYCKCDLPKGVSDKISLFFYGGPLVPPLRYRAKRSRSVRREDFIGGLLYENMLANPAFTEAAVITYVPRDPGKVRKFGVDQARDLARGLSRHSAKPAVKLLKCVRGAGEQKTLDKQARAENIAGKYAFCDNFDINGKTIILADDVLTTGTTVSECAEILRHAGAAKILAVSVAQTKLER